MTSLTLGTIVASALLFASGSVAVGSRELPRGVTRADLQRHDLSIAGREVVQATITLAPGARAPEHSHPGEEIIYVLEGTFEYRVAGRAIRLERGGVLFVPAGQVHSATNIGTGNAVELATYVVEKGKPLLVAADKSVS